VVTLAHAIFRRGSVSRSDHSPNLAQLAKRGWREETRMGRRQGRCSTRRPRPDAATPPPLDFEPPAWPSKRRGAATNPLSRTCWPPAVTVADEPNDSSLRCAAFFGGVGPASAKKNRCQSLPPLKRTVIGRPVKLSNSDDLAARYAMVVAAAACIGVCANGGDGMPATHAGVFGGPRRRAGWRSGWAVATDIDDASTGSLRGTTGRIAKAPLRRLRSFDLGAHKAGRLMPIHHLPKNHPIDRKATDG